jgi:hypothetical protein
MRSPIERSEIRERFFRSISPDFVSLNPARRRWSMSLDFAPLNRGYKRG